MMNERPDGAPITAAFYLPQFHRIAENDEWWGDGFTEWTNVRRAVPLYEGHHHPVVPEGPYGYYDLTQPGVYEWQTDLASRYDVDAFIFYHYWFDGHRLLEKPLDSVLAGNNPFPFAICWANENWTRRWDGKEHEVLMGQSYGPDVAAAVFESFLPYMRDPRYLRLDGKAVVFVHRADHLPSAAEYARTWRVLARARGVGELWLVASETSHGLVPEVLGFDAIGEFPPVGDSLLSTSARRLPKSIVPGFKGRLNDYGALAAHYLGRQQPRFRRHPAVVPRWDNTARRGVQSTSFAGSTPDGYATWLSAARQRELRSGSAAGMVLINAWNEWAEGAYLEPDAHYGYAYLEATRWNYEVRDRNALDGSVLFDGSRNIAGSAKAAAASGVRLAKVARSRTRGSASR
ncbi:glycosyltransferase WbsX family protein [Nocardioides humi]|uniref:Glycosyltransferase WbsX n=1 Tax=Nocardioides humi TaxID=449461 RepID=A0ABN2AID6_9ACTN|nr:glycoside hydrolase family 99-like domain-containing protein [Nocardioides humi]